VKHRLRQFGHECDRFVVRGMECPFRKQEEEEDDDEDAEEEHDSIRFPQVLPIPMRRQRGADAVRGDNVIDFTNAVAQGETRKALERMAAFQNEGGLQFIPRMNTLLEGLSGQKAQNIFAILSALAITAAFVRGRGGSLRTQSLGVAGSERLVAERLSRPSGLKADPGQELFDEKRRGLRRFFGFGPAGGFDSFSETGFP